MKVLGFAEEITTCDCCGKRNLRGTFVIETDAGDLLHYGSVCVNRVYGKKRSGEIKFLAEQIRKAQAGTWEQAISLYSRGYLQPFSAYFADGKLAWNNSREQMAAVTSIRYHRTGQVVRERAA